jgi:hypothetical protein
MLMNLTSFYAFVHGHSVCSACSYFKTPCDCDITYLDQVCFSAK